MDFSYKLVYSKRKNITITVERDRTIVVRAPEHVNLNEVKSVIERKKLWLYEKLKHPQKYSEVKRKEFVSGEAILYLGKNYRLEVAKDGAEDIRFNGKFVVTGVSSDRAGHIFKKWYTQKAKEKIVPRANRFAQDIGVSFNNVIITDLKYRWGSCTPRDNININWKLIKAPMFVIDYVLVHELTHLIEHNHTPRFWGIVRTQVPGYEKAKLWLKEHGAILENDF